MRNFNIKENYVDEDDPWSGILAPAEFAISSTTNRLKIYSLGQLVFDHNIITLIKHKLDWELICQRE